MKATVLHGAGDVRVEDVPDAKVLEPTDAVIRIFRACICGSDLWPYRNLDPSEGACIMGHEAIGIVEDIGPEVRAVKLGDLGAAGVAAVAEEAAVDALGLQTVVAEDAGAVGIGEGHHDCRRTRRCRVDRPPSTETL